MPTNRPLLVLAASIAVAGCLADDAEFRSAPPRTSQVTIPVPGGSAEAAGASDPLGSRR